MSRSSSVKILFVCLGNICRSPTAEAVFAHQASQQGVRERLWLDSAGTYGGHQGHAPDQRAQTVAQQRGITQMGKLKARRIKAEDFEQFDLILAMDLANLEDLRTQCPASQQHKLQLFLSVLPGLNDYEVPDPYYGPVSGFEHVFDLCQQASDAWLESLKGRNFMLNRPPL